MLSFIDISFYLLGINEINVQGFANFFGYNITNWCVSYHKIYKRISDLSGNYNDTTCFFIDNCNLQSMSSYHFIGHLVAVQDTVWRIGMILFDELQYGLCCISTKCIISKKDTWWDLTFHNINAVFFSSNVLFIGYIFKMISLLLESTYIW